jgi:hypothetical protein
MSKASTFSLEAGLAATIALIREVQTRATERRRDRQQADLECYRGRNETFAYAASPRARTEDKRFAKLAGSGSGSPSRMRA